MGYGYSVEWREVNSRRFGRNLFPSRIVFETQEDYLRYCGKAADFSRFEGAVNAIRQRHTVLEDWIRSNIATLTELSAEVDGLLEVVHALAARPRPACFARELPVSVDTKFVERHAAVLRQWLDRVLPPHVIRADEDHFERRFGLRYAEPHLQLRFLDPLVQHKMGFPCDVLSLPLHSLGLLPGSGLSVLIVENKVNLLTVPHRRLTIALGGLGNGVSLLRYVPWLGTCNIVYWGDLDVEGLTILSSLRALYPNIQSQFMNEGTIAAWRHLAVDGTNRSLALPPHLTSEECRAFAICARENLRIEQERIPQSAVATALGDQPLLLS